MKTIKLYGHLGRKYGKLHKYYVENVTEAIKLLSANYKEFEKDLINFNGGYRIIVGNEDILEEDLCSTVGKDTIKIIPIITGQGGDIGKIIMGTVLVAAAFYMGPMAVGEIATLESTVISYGIKAMSSFGMSMILGGIAELLYVPPPAPPKQAVSGSFDGAVNTTRQGVPIAVGYGELIVGSAVISAGLSTVPVPV